MHISFSSMTQKATLAFTSTDPPYLVLHALAAGAASLSPDDLVTATSLSKRAVNLAIATLMTQGLIYEEQDGYVHLSRYGQGIVSHMQSSAQTEYNYVLPDQRNYKMILLALLREGTASMNELVSTGPGKAALQELVRRGFVVTAGDENYTLSPLGTAYITRVQEQQEFAKNEQTPKLEKTSMPSAQTAFLDQMYTYFKREHPEYWYIYELVEKDRPTFFNDIRKFLRGGPIEPPYFNNVKELTKYWGGPTAPAQTSLEAAFMHEIRYMMTHTGHIAQKVPKMSDIVLGRTYATTLAERSTPARIANALKEFKPGTMLSSQQILALGAKIVGKAFPTGLNAGAITSLISNTLRERRTVGSGVFFPEDAPEAIAEELKRRLKAGDVASLTQFTETATDFKEQVVASMFGPGADYSGGQLVGLEFAGLGELRGVNFSAANISGVSFEDMHVRECNFEGANLTGVNLKGTHFENNNIAGADFSNAMGLGEEDTQFDFGSCQGQPKNFPKIRRSELNTAELPRITDVRTRMDNEQVHVSPVDHPKATTIAAPLLKELYNVLHTRLGRRVLQLLRFSAIDTPGVSDEQKATDVRALLADGTRAEWMTQPALIEYLKSNAGEPFGITQRDINKAIGRIAGPKPPRAAPVAPPVVEQTSTVLNAVRTALAVYPVSRASLTSAFGAEYPEYTEFLDRLPEQLGTRELQRFTAYVAKFTARDDASARVTEMRTKIRMPSYMGRLTNTTRADRAKSSTEYKDRMFGVLLNPVAVGVADPNVKKILDDINTGDLTGELSHWRKTIASARIEPHRVTEIDPSTTGQTTKNIWVITELQADPLQTQSYGYAHLFSDLLPTNWRDSLYTDVSLGSSAAALLSKFSSSSNIPLTAVEEKDVPALDKLKSSNLVQKVGATLKITELGKALTFAYDVLHKFRALYKNWPSAVILETINRALQLGGVDEIWVVSAEALAREEGLGLDAVYDAHAKKFTDKTVPGDLNIKDTASKLFHHDVPKPDKFYVINVAEWRDMPGLKMSSLTVEGGRYATKAERYVERAKESHPYIATVLPLSALYSSALAFWIRKESLPPAGVPAALADIEATTGVQVQQPITNWVHLLVNGVNSVQKKLVRKVRRDHGSSPNRLAHESLEFFLDKHTEVGPEERELFHQYFDTLWAAHGQELFGDALSAHENYIPGVTESEGGDQFVGPSGEPSAEGGGGGDEGLSDVDKLIQQQNKERAAQPPEVPQVQFSPPNASEQRAMTEQEIDRLLDRLQVTQSEAEKAQIRRQLHELSTMGSLHFAALTAESIVVHEHGKWKVKTHDGRKTLGVHDSKADAERQLRAIEMHKHSALALTFAAADLQIEPVTPEDHQRVLALRSNVFSVVSATGAPDTYYAGIVDWSLCRKVVTSDGHIVGAYLIGRRQMPDVLSSIPGLTVYEDLSKYAGRTGVEGVSVFIEQPFRGRVGSQLLDTPYTIPNVDYIWGFAHKKLGNIDRWKQRRRVVAENDQLYVTAVDVRPLTMQQRLERSMPLYPGFHSYDIGSSVEKDGLEYKLVRMERDLDGTHVATIWHPRQGYVKINVGQLQRDRPLTFAAVDQEFNHAKNGLGDAERNDWWAYEPAHGEAAPVGGGSMGDGAADDTSNMDMSMGGNSFYTDLSLPDMQQKKKQLVDFEPSSHVNLQPSFASAEFDFVRFKTAIMGGLRGLNEFRGMTDEQVAAKLEQEWQWAKQAGVV